MTNFNQPHHIHVFFYFFFQVHATCQELITRGHEAFSYRVDCSKKEEIFKAAEQVREEVGNISVLVNNAGTASFKMVMDMDGRDVERTFAVNTLCHFWVRVGVKLNTSCMLAIE